MREIIPGIFIWGSTYGERPWALNGYAIQLVGGAVLVDPPAPTEEEWPSLDRLRPIEKIVLTNRDHVREAGLFRARYGAALIAGAEEVSQFTTVVIDESVREAEVIAAGLRVIDLPGKSPGEIGLYLDPTTHAVSRELGGILILGDAMIGHPRGAVSLIPQDKLDNPALLKRSLRKLCDYKFEVLLFCDGEPVLENGKQMIVDFLQTLI
jgi:glyoxylase-like metal-dependent hydrolase (beta-lactamase superfamily II)